jgi:HK97 family phage prohead protease
MPYFITDTAVGCSGWATIKDDGEIVGCHTSKQDAIDQMVAISLAEGMEPGGERNTMTKVETRQVQVQDLELREEGSTRTFAGYAAVFNSDSEPLPFIEQIRPGAFERTLSSRNQIKMFVNHEDTMVLASTRAGTLRLSEDNRGLKVEADMPETSYARDLSVLMQRGDVDSMSFGFHVPRGGDEWSDDGQRRYLNEIALREVSVVTGFPAYEATSATIRKAQLLAQRTETDADALADALTALEAGNELNDDQANLLVDVVDRQRVKAEPTVDASEVIGVLREKLDLLAKAV